MADPSTGKDDVKIQVALARHEERLKALEERIGELLDLKRIVADLRVEIAKQLGKIEMQTKVTWVLLLIVIGGLVSVAFSVWQNGGVP